MKYEIIYFIILSLMIIVYGNKTETRKPNFIKPIIEEPKRNTYHKLFQSLDNRVQKNTAGITNNSKVLESLTEFSKDLVSAIKTKFDAQAKITKLTKEAIDSLSGNRGVTIIETRRLLDFLSDTISSLLLAETTETVEPELQKFVYGVSQTAAEVAIIGALKELTYANALAKRQTVDFTMRKRRSIAEKLAPESTATILSTTRQPEDGSTSTVSVMSKESELEAHLNPFSVIKDVQSIRAGNALAGKVRTNNHAFLNRTKIDTEEDPKYAVFDVAQIIDEPVNTTQTINEGERLTPPEIEADNDTSLHRLSVDEIINEDDVDDSETGKIKDPAEEKAKKAIDLAGEIAYATASSVIATRKAMTASLEVHMAARYIRNKMLSVHQELMLNLAKAAAKQVARDAKKAHLDSQSCDRGLKLAIKLISQSSGAKSNPLANRVLVDALAMSTIAKSMSYVSGDMAIKSLYEANVAKA